MFPCIQFTLTAAHTYLFRMLPYLVNWSCQHHTLEIPQVHPPPCDKRSWPLRPTAPPFLYKYMFIPDLEQTRFLEQGLPDLEFLLAPTHN
jgi:hypothetical protein